MDTDARRTQRPDAWPLRDDRRIVDGERFCTAWYMPDERAASRPARSPTFDPHFVVPWEVPFAALPAPLALGFGSAAGYKATPAVRRLEPTNGAAPPITTQPWQSGKPR